MNLFVAVEPNSWQNIELPKEEEEDLTGDTMTCFLGTKYRNCNAIDGFVEYFFLENVKTICHWWHGNEGMKSKEVSSKVFSLFLPFIF